MESDYPICIKKMGGEEYLTENGWFNFDLGAKCVIYPKGKTTWKGFVPPCKFKDGDIVYTIGDNIAILGDRIGEYSVGFNSYCGLFNYEFDLDVIVSPERLATEEEKEQLFRAIENNGYKWNAKTKTLVKLIEPKFKVGDRIKWIKTGNIYEIIKILSNCYIANYLGSDITILLNRQDEYELVPNKFDINTLIPFESRVLVRNSDGDVWRPAIYGVIDSKKHYYYVVGGIYWMHCIPFEPNKELLGTTNDCDKYFKA